MVKLRRIWFLLIILFAIMGIQPVSHAASVIQTIDRNLENEIGYYNYHTVLSMKRTIQLPEVDNYRLNRVFEALTAYVNRGEVKYQLQVVQDDSVNAFALPGGYLFVNSGLLAFVQSDGELAGVLGHEIAHVERRHGMKAIYRTAGMSIGWKALMYGNRSKQKVKLDRLAALSMTMIQLGYSRDAEFEADQYGVELMQKAGYNKQELLNFWRRVETETSDGLKLSGIFQVFSTHPPIKERIKRIESMN